MKERVQKMNGRKMEALDGIYQGSEYRFKVTDCEGKHGGNGGVYEVELIGKKLPYPVVVKFFEYNKNPHEREKRYQRFLEEIKVVREQLNGIDGIMEILDADCPAHVPGQGEQAWYMMRKAEEYPICRKRKLGYKLKDMLRLAHILDILHDKGYAHRDIKPENLLILDGKLCLSDFGLVWTEDRPERLTDAQDRVGPYLILPPELEHVDVEANIDFYPSDVYLFAKVLWMAIKEDSFGFRGQYKRSNRQVYLQKSLYEVKTLEPVHRLIEQATYYEIEKRISIKECIAYLEQQIAILEDEPVKRLPEDELNALCHAEVSRTFVEQTEPDEYTYTDRAAIYRYLDDVLQYSVINVIDPSGNAKGIRVNALTKRADGYATLDFLYQGKKTKEYLFRAKKLVCRKKDNVITAEIELAGISDCEEAYVNFEKMRFGFGNVDKKIFLPDGYRLEIKVL